MKATEPVSFTPMPQGPRKLATKCGATTLTQYVGIHLLHRFLSRTGFEDGVARQLRVTVQSQPPSWLIFHADSTRHFFANETYCHLILLARNLVNWFKQFCLRPALQNDTPQILRHRVLPMLA